MLRLEKRLINRIVEARKYLFYLAVFILGAYVRVAGRDFVSRDMEVFLIPWFDELLNNGGISGLRYQVGNYNLLYQTLIALLTYIDIKSIYLYKLLSCVFDYLLAYSGALLVCRLKRVDWKKDYLFELTFCVILFLPPVVLNSSVWGQCDCIYTVFLVLMLYFLLEERFRLAFVFFGIAFAFKLQAIFLLPFVIYLYFTRKNFSILNLGFSLLSFWVSGILCYFRGRSILEPFWIYGRQTNTYHEMSLNYPSFWLLLGNDYYTLKGFAMALTMILLGIGLLVVLKLVEEQKHDLTDQKLLLLAVWTVWTCILFLPAMHERYSYPLDVLLVILCLVNVRFLAFAVFEIMLSILTYGNYLFANGRVSPVYGIVNVLVWIAFTVMVYSAVAERNVFSKKTF